MPGEQMVDQAVEFDVVTADGQYRTVNKCNDPGLFYALRGGGGSTFAAVSLCIPKEIEMKSSHVIQDDQLQSKTVSLDSAPFLLVCCEHIPPL